MIIGVVCTLAMLFQVAAAETRTVAEILELMKVPMTPAEPLIPAGTRILDARPDQTGRRVGEVDLVQGEVYLLPSIPGVAYRVTKRQDVYAGDSLVTGEHGKVVLALNDQSSIGLAEYTRLRLTRIRFNAKAKTRDSEVALDHGRARFRISKVPTDSVNFRIKTPAAIAGVRGSDLAVGALGPNSCVITAADTRVTVTGASGGEATLGANQLVWSQGGALLGVSSIGAQGLPVLEGISPGDSLSSMSMPDHLYPKAHR